MDVHIRQYAPLQGTLRVPPDKAICHRAVLAAAVASGETAIHPWPSADDCQQTLAAIQQLGVVVRHHGDTVRIQGSGHEGLRAPSGPIFCGESGTTFRLLAGVLAGQPFPSTLAAGPALSRRPMRRIVEPLSLMGARCHGMASTAAPRELFPPLTIQGTRPLKAIRYPLPVASAQVKSAILLAGLSAQGRTTVIEPYSTRNHTEHMLRRFHVRVMTTGPEVSLEAGALTSPGEVVLPGDCSSAAFLIVAACCVPGSSLTLTEVGLNPTRTGLLKVLERMGASVRVHVSGDDAWEPRGTIAAEACSLQATAVEPSEVSSVIDELPILMVAAACARGTTRFRGIGELRVKETDRLASMVTGLQQLGAQIRLPAPDTVEIEGGPLRGAVVQSAGDHRTAMSLAVAGLVAQGTTTIQGAECVAKSFPEFFAQMRQVAGAATVKSVDKV